MSIKATNFVRNLRGLSISERAVAFVLASHENRNGEGAWPSMRTVAAEASLKHRTIAGRIADRLIAKGVLRETKIEGRPTVYHFVYGTCDSPVTRQAPTTCDSPVTPPVTLDGPTCDSGDEKQVLGVTLEAHTCDSPVTQKGLKEKKEKENQEKGEGQSSLALATPTPEVLPPVSIPQAFKVFGENAEAMGRPFGTPEFQRQWASLYDGRSRLTSDLMEEQIVTCRKKKIIVPGLWYELKKEYQRAEAREAFPQNHESFAERNRRKAHREFSKIDARSEQILQQLQTKADKPATKEISAKTCSLCGSDGWKVVNGKAVRCDHQGRTA